jgi:hypothetical protein
LGSEMKMAPLLLHPVLIVAACIVAVGAWVWYEKARFDAAERRMEEFSAIRIASFMYAEDHAGHFPADWSGVLSYSNQTMFSIDRKTSDKKSIFLCPSRWPEYRYIGGMTTVSPPDLILAYRLPKAESETGRRLIVVSGSMRWLSNEEFSNSLVKTLQFVREPNHAVEPTRAPEGARGSP